MFSFIKILKYELRPPDFDIFSYQCDLVSQKIDPTSLEKDKLITTGATIFHSDLKRASSCLAIRPEAHFISTALLREIPFDLDILCGREPWEERGSSAVREGFIRGFIEDRLLISREEILNQTAEFFTLIQNTPMAHEAISHSFRMKIIQAYYETRGKLGSHPELITSFINPGRKTFPFGGGFDISRFRI